MRCVDPYPPVRVLRDSNSDVIALFENTELLKALNLGKGRFRKAQVHRQKIFAVTVNADMFINYRFTIASIRNPAAAKIQSSAIQPSNDFDVIGVVSFLVALKRKILVLCKPNE